MRRFENLKSSHNVSNRIDTFQNSNRIDTSRMVSIGFERKPVFEKPVLRPLDNFQTPYFQSENDKKILRGLIKSRLLNDLHDWEIVHDRTWLSCMATFFMHDFS